MSTLKQVANTKERLWEMLKLEIKQEESTEKGNYGGEAYESWVTEIRSMKKKNKDKASFLTN